VDFRTDPDVDQTVGTDADIARPIAASSVIDAIGVRHGVSWRGSSTGGTPSVPNLR